MLKIIMLGFVLAAIVLSGTMFVADAEKIMSSVPDTITMISSPLVPTMEMIPSPFQQVRNGVPADEVVCSYGRILMTSPSVVPACVFAGSVEMLEQRGFALPSEMPRDVLSPKRPKTSEKAGITSSSAASKTGDRPFVTTWRTTSPNEWIIVPVGGATGIYTVDWGDDRTTANVTGNQIHSYKKAGTYTVAITGNFERIYLDGHTINPSKLNSIEQWGDIKWISMGSAFKGARNMIYNADDIPNLSGVTDMSYMFFDASSFDGDVSSWDVSEVTDMSYMFSNTPSFNGDLSAWDVSSLNNMRHMFWNSHSFNNDLSGWDVSEVSSMYGAFSGASSFDGDVSAWDVSNVDDMTEMFYDASSFDGDISRWNVSKVTDMFAMFYDASSFDGDISRWNVSKVTDTAVMFYGASSFDGDISRWDVSNVDNTDGMFSGSTSFNGNLSVWDVSSVSIMRNMFSGATSFNGDISRWDVSNVDNMDGMFSGATSFNGDISAWDVSSVMNMNDMFDGAYSFNGDISAWDVSNVNYMSEMLMDFTYFSQNLGEWYITIDNTSINIVDGTKIIGNIAAQNFVLDRQDIAYEIGSGADSAYFEIDGDTLLIKPSANYSGKTEYAVNITSTGDFGVNNFRVINVTVTGAGDADPN